MFRFLFQSAGLLLLLQISSLAGLAIQNYIYNGKSVGLQGHDANGNEIVVNDGEFPYMVALDENGQHVCGGVIIQSNAILTTDHCVHGLDPGIFKVRAGTLNFWPGYDNTTQTLEVSEITSHPGFRPSDNYNDIAIMWLKGNFTFNKYVNKVNMSTLIGSNLVGENFTTIGWGSDGKSARTATLKSAEHTAISLTTCRKIHHQYSVPDTMLCAIDNQHLQTICSGDSGGPIVEHHPGRIEKDVLVGLVSSGLCEPALPSLFTDIGKMHKWVLGELKKRNGVHHI